MASRGGKCERCGGEYPPQIFHFHHVDPGAKTRNLVWKAWAVKRMDAVLEEAARCLMLCPTCHALEHLRINQESIQ